MSGSHEINGNRYYMECGAVSSACDNYQDIYEAASADGEADPYEPALVLALAMMMTFITASLTAVAAWVIAPNSWPAVVMATVGATSWCLLCSLPALIRASRPSRTHHYRRID